MSVCVESFMNFAAIADQSLFSPSLMAAVLLTTQDEIARTIGLGRDAIARKDRVGSAKTQTRLREMAEIVNRVEPRFGSALLAYAWFRSDPLPGYGGLTAMHLLQQGRAAEVMDLIDAVDAGVHA
jgi:hypothetical protein